MNMQESLIKRLNQNYPNSTLKEISQLTGIQLTRVFRILNGYEMKVKEYEIIENIILKKSQSNRLSQHIELYTKYIKFQNIDRQKTLEQKYSKEIELSNFEMPYTYLNLQNDMQQGEINA
jgi:hypothetical protein